MVQSSMLTNWGCPIHGFEGKHDVKQTDHLQLPGPRHHGVPSPLSLSVSSQSQVPEVRRLRRDVTSVSEKERQPKAPLPEAENKEHRVQTGKKDHTNQHKRSKREAPKAFDHPKKKEVDFK